MNFNKYFKTLPVSDTYALFVRDPVVCADGFTMSVQASSFHYCSPKKDNADFYTKFEVGFPTKVEGKLLPYAEDAKDPTETVYACVPVEVIEKVIEKHGGILKETKCSL